MRGTFSARVRLCMAWHGRERPACRLAGLHWVSCSRSRRADLERGVQPGLLCGADLPGAGPGPLPPASPCRAPACATSLLPVLVAFSACLLCMCVEPAFLSSAAEYVNHVAQQNHFICCALYKSTSPLNAGLLYRRPVLCQFTESQDVPRAVRQHNHSPASWLYCSSSFPDVKCFQCVSPDKQVSSSLLISIQQSQPLLLHGDRW